MDRVVSAPPAATAMRVAFRVDASLQIGTGHVMRCLTLANALHERGAQCEFVCRAHAGHLAARIEAAGHAVHLLPLPSEDSRDDDPTGTAHAHWLGCGWRRDAVETAAALGSVRRDWLVVDHYALDARWESEMRSHAAHMMAIDDLADRPHEVELLLNQNLGRAAADYRALVPLTTRCLIGPDYALLRPEFARLRDYSLARRSGAPLRRILVSLGGVDRDNATGVVLKALSVAHLPRDVQVMVVMGRQAPGRESIRAQASRMPFACEVRVDVDDMAQVMADADLAIGAAGSSSWERCALGLPSIMVVLAENQRGIAAVLENAGAAVSIPGDGRMLCDLADAVRLLTDRAARSALGESANGLVDGLGTIRTVAVMESL
jgi:UDP-2,4-diacetamido-2,4,6-trideoxy-beta-L-altropyranose hydrolase